MANRSARASAGQNDAISQFAPHPTPSASPERNRLLRSLSPASLALFAPHLDSVHLSARQSLWESNKPIRSVFFPRTCVASLLVPLTEGLPVESATIGCEGFVGVPVLLGAESTTSWAIAQVPGAALRLPVAVFREAVSRDDELRALLLRYAQVLQEETAQSVACNSRHSMEERCARWLLMTQDRVAGPEFQLTQEFLASMLGVRRATVTIAAGMLQQAGLIRYTRGHITVLNREGLEAASCECYRVARSSHERLLT